MSQWLGRLLRTQEWRRNDECWIAGNAAGEVFRLRAGLTPSVDSCRGPRFCRLSWQGFGRGEQEGSRAKGDACPSRPALDEGVVSFLTRSRGIFAVSTARSLCCSILLNQSACWNSSIGGAAGASALVFSTVLTRPSSEVSVSVALAASASVGAICSIRRCSVPR